MAARSHPIVGSRLVGCQLLLKLRNMPLLFVEDGCKLLTARGDSQKAQGPVHEHMTEYRI